MKIVVGTLVAVTLVAVMLVGGVAFAQSPTPGASDCCDCSGVCSAPAGGSCGDCTIVTGAACVNGDCLTHTPTKTKTVTPTATPTRTQTNTRTVTVTRTETPTQTPTYARANTPVDSSTTFTQTGATEWRKQSMSDSGPAELVPASARRSALYYLDVTADGATVVTIHSGGMSLDIPVVAGDANKALSRHFSPPLVSGFAGTIYATQSGSAAVTFQIQSASGR